MEVGSITDEHGTVVGTIKGTTAKALHLDQQVVQTLSSIPEVPPAETIEESSAATTEAASNDSANDPFASAMAWRWSTGKVLQAGHLRQRVGSALSRVCHGTWEVPDQAVCATGTLGVSPRRTTAAAEAIWSAPSTPKACDRRRGGAVLASHVEVHPARPGPALAMGAMG
jgi:hypothetical protein